jgi:putative flippase GtrA
MPTLPRSVGSRVLGLRSPDSGTLGQGVRFALAGGFVGVIYLAVTTVAADVLKLPFQLALLIGFLTALCVHFTLQRWFVWVNDSEFAHRFDRQIGRYLLVTGMQYVVTLTTTSLVPSAIGVPVTLVYYATVLVLATVNFLLFRAMVFNAR